VVEGGGVTRVTVIIEDCRTGTCVAERVTELLGRRVSSTDGSQTSVKILQLPAPPQQIDEGVVQVEDWVTGAIGDAAHQASHGTVAVGVRAVLDAVPDVHEIRLVQTLIDGGSIDGLNLFGGKFTEDAVVISGSGRIAGGEAARTSVKGQVNARERTVVDAQVGTRAIATKGVGLEHYRVGQVGQVGIGDFIPIAIIRLVRCDSRARSTRVELTADGRCSRIRP